MMKSQQLLDSSDGGINRDLSKKSTNVGDSIPIDNSVNHYELPNLAQHTSLRELPYKIGPNTLMKFVKKKIENNLSVREPQVMKKLTGGGLFGEFEWVPDSYDNFIKAKQEEKRYNELLQKNISDKPFILGTNNHKWKYQDCFIDDQALKDYVFPFLNIDDPYEATKEEILRAKWLEENKILNGEFKPALADKSLERVTKQQLPDIVNYIKKVVMVDWAEVNFIIGTNPDSFIEIKFDQKSVDTELGLKAYMNTLITTHDVISQFNLKKVLKYWGYRDEKHIYFMLAPPWIKFNPAHVYSSCLQMQVDKNESEVKTEQPQTSNLFKISNQFNKSSVLIKDPTLYSKDIEI